MTTLPTGDRRGPGPAPAAPVHVLASGEFDGTFDVEEPRSPRRVALSGALAVAACAACCALPLLVGAGTLTAGAAAALNQTLLAVSVGLVVLAVVFWGRHQRRRTAVRAASSHGGGTCGCGGGCSC